MTPDEKPWMFKVDKEGVLHINPEHPGIEPIDIKELMEQYEKDLKKWDARNAMKYKES